MVRALTNGSEGPGFKITCMRDFIKTLFVHPKLVNGYQLFSELGMIKAARKRGGSPHQLHHWWYNLAL